MTRALYGVLRVKPASHLAACTALKPEMSRFDSNLAPLWRSGRAAQQGKSVPSEVVSIHATHLERAITKLHGPFLKDRGSGKGDTRCSRDGESRGPNDTSGSPVPDPLNSPSARTQVRVDTADWRGPLTRAAPDVLRSCARLHWRP